MEKASKLEELTCQAVKYSRICRLEDDQSTRAEDGEAVFTAWQGECAGEISLL